MLIQHILGAITCFFICFVTGHGGTAEDPISRSTYIIIKASIHRLFHSIWPINAIEKNIGQNL